MLIRIVANLPHIQSSSIRGLVRLVDALVATSAQASTPGIMGVQVGKACIFRTNMPGGVTSTFWESIEVFRLLFRDTADRVYAANFIDDLLRHHRSPKTTNKFRLRLPPPPFSHLQVSPLPNPSKKPWLRPCLERSLPSPHTVLGAGGGGVK